MLSELDQKVSDNQYNYDGLVSVIEAGQQMMTLIIAACTVGEFQEELIGRYEAELAPSMASYRVSLDRSEPSLRAVLEQLVHDHPVLQEPQATAVISVMGADRLLSIPIRAEETNSALDRFFGYLQWTREGLREFPYPIVLWVTPKILAQLSTKSPDFWSWRAGVFRFVAPVSNIPNISFEDYQTLGVVENTRSTDLPLDELLENIVQLEQQDNMSPALATLFDRVGQVYADQKTHEGAAQAIEYFQRAIKIQSSRNLRAAELRTSVRLKNLYYQRLSC